MCAFVPLQGGPLQFRTLTERKKGTVGELGMGGYFPGNTHLLRHGGPGGGMSEETGVTGSQGQSLGPGG